MHEPKMHGTNATPPRSGPKGPIIFPPIHAPITPKTAAVKNPPGIVPGTRRSAIKAHTAATITNKIRDSISITIKLLNLLN
jgi:hypothetical protein